MGHVVQQGYLGVSRLRADQRTVGLSQGRIRYVAVQQMPRGPSGALTFTEPGHIEGPRSAEGV